VERISGPLQLDGQYSCGSLPAANSTESADLLLFVHARPEPPTSSTAAYASSCQIDQNGRPISGHVGIAADTSTGVFTGSQHQNTLIIAHEVFHAMGFSSSSWVRISVA
jgi:hypothetical protein